MNITSNYQMHSVNFGSKSEVAKRIVKQATVPPELKNAADGVISKKGAQAVAASALATVSTTIGISQMGKREKDTDFGKVVYEPEMPRLDVIRKNGMEVKLFDGIPQEVLESPIRAHMSPPNAHTVNPKVIVFHLVQNASKPVEAIKGIADGSVKECMAENNLNEVPMKLDVENYSPYLSSPYTGKQYVSGNFVRVKYGETQWGTDDYNKEFSDPATGKAPDIAVVADQSIMGAGIADKQYDIVQENGTRIPVNYSQMDPKVKYMISKRPGVELGGFFTPTEVTSSEKEKLAASKFVMVDSELHCYDANPIDRILKGDVTWLVDESDPAQLKIKNMIDEIFKLKAEAGKADEAGNKELADKLNKEAKELTNLTKQEAAVWVEEAQKATGEEYFI